MTVGEIREALEKRNRVCKEGKPGFRKKCRERMLACVDILCSDAKIDRKNYDQLSPDTMVSPHATAAFNGLFAWLDERAAKKAAKLEDKSHSR